ncbi:unnamed protein product [Durusdinium trenchii]|uniref:DRBM domain-containing protein n=2 Tax=Durusdinium trenchii TaxID=1381693 RepID=A0ABP0R3H7_9DINO
MAATLRLGKKSWTLPAAPNASCICILNEWCQAIQAELHWELRQTGPHAESSTGADDAVDLWQVGERSDSLCKGRLGTWQQRLNRPVVPGAVEYISQMWYSSRTEFQWLCTVHLHCMSSQGSPPVCFTGRPLRSKKEAEQSAAWEAVSELTARNSQHQ